MSEEAVLENEQQNYITAQRKAVNTMIDYRENIQKRMEAIKVRVPAVSRKAEIHMQTLYNFLNGREMTTKTLSSVLDALTELEQEVEHEFEQELK